MRYRWFADKPRKKGPGGELLPAEKEPQEQEDKPKGKLSGGEKTSLLLVTVMLCWGIANGDTPFIFFCLAFIVYELRPFAEILGPFGQTLSNMMRGFSIALALGALAWVFL